MSIWQPANCKCIIQYEDSTPLILGLPKWVKSIRRCKRHSELRQAHLVAVVAEDRIESKRFGKNPSESEILTIEENLRVLKEAS